MALFRKKIVGVTDTLGDRLHRLREEAGLPLDAVAARTGISEKHLHAIEEGRYSDLPGLVYARNFVRKYAAVLEVREETVLQMFDREYAVGTKVAPPRSTAPLRPIRHSIGLTPIVLRRALILLLGLVVLVYLGVELRHLTSPPIVTIASPPEQLTIAERAVELVGSTEPETTVTANGKPVLVDRQGNFREVLDLQDGLNTILIRAVKKRGQATVVTRNILVQP